jgi:hypothetical protein
LALKLKLFTLNGEVFFFLEFEKSFPFLYNNIFINYILLFFMKDI